MMYDRVSMYIYMLSCTYVHINNLFTCTYVHVNNLIHTIIVNEVINMKGIINKCVSSVCALLGREERYVGRFPDQLRTEPQVQSSIHTKAFATLFFGLTREE